MTIFIQSLDSPLSNKIGEGVERPPNLFKGDSMLQPQEIEDKVQAIIDEMKDNPTNNYSRVVVDQLNKTIATIRRGK